MERAGKRPKCLGEGERPSLLGDAWPKVLSTLPTWAHWAAAPACVPGGASRERAGAHELLSTASRAAVSRVQQASPHRC